MHAQSVAERELGAQRDVSGSGGGGDQDGIKAVLSAKRDDHELGAGLVNIIANIPR